MQEREDFIKGLKRQAVQYDLTKMPIEDVILKVLEENGLNPELSKNPEFRKQMNDIFKWIFIGENNRDCEFSEKVSMLRKAISSGLKDYSFSITADGNFEYDKENDGNKMESPRERKFFTVDNEGKLYVITTSKYSRDQEYNKTGERSPETFTTYQKQQEVFDSNGLQTNKIYGTKERSDKQYHISESSRRVIRNPDLVTATIYIYPDYCKTDYYEIDNPHSKFPDDIGSVNTVSYKYDVNAIGQYPEKLSYPMNIGEEELKQKLEEREKDPYQRERKGVEYYKKLMSDYLCIPEPISDDEKAYREAYIQKELENAAKRSPIIKKIAEERGLLPKEK